MARLVLTDTSPLVGLSRVGGVGWLKELFGTVEMTRTVRLELERGGLEPESAKTLESGWLRSRGEDTSSADCPPHLGGGEWSMIAAALEHEGPVLLLVDDRLARRESRSVGLGYTGTAAIIGLAEQRRNIKSAVRFSSNCCVPILASLRKSSVPYSRSSRRRTSSIHRPESFQARPHRCIRCQRAMREYG